jgi:hypothetical protein|tara:strand:+ start:2147 stop:2845 length:699 start_codon:yes stop_codon:yes gene_type:complete
MNDNDISRIADALESIAADVKVMVSRPLPMRKIEERLAKAVEVHDQVSDIVVAEAGKESAAKAITKKEEKTTDGEITEGVRVVIDSESVNNGCIGTIVSKTSAWITVAVEEGNDKKKKGESISVRKNECKVLADDENVATVSEDTEVIEEEEIDAPATKEFVVDENDTEHPGNFRFDRGAKSGQTIHIVYSEGDSGVTFVLYAAFKQKHNEHWTKPCQDYLALHGITEHPIR